MDDAGPVTPSERIEIIDILRGFAIMGILVVNIAGFSRTTLKMNWPAPNSWYDKLAANVETLLFMGKFYPIFSFLFGLGFCLTLARAEARGEDIRAFYRRRLWFLLAIGLSHAALLWPGEILRLYAALGFALLAFRGRRVKTLLIWAGVSVLLAFVTNFGLYGIVAAAGWDDGHIVFAGIDMYDYSREAYDSSWPWPVIGYQTVLLPLGTLSLYLSQGCMSFSMFLVGLAAGRGGLFQRLGERRTALITLLITLPIGLAGSATLLLDNPVALLVGFASAPLLSAAYVSALSSLSLTSVGGRILRPLSDVGRMALTNYVGQSMICAVLFDGYGFGLHETIGEAALFGIAIGIFLAQVPLSRWWLSRYRFGPLEWAWRSMTYRRRQPMRLTAGARGETADA